MVQSVSDALGEFNVEISKPESKVKNDIYAVAAAFSDAVKTFANELLDSIKNELGQCQVITTRLDPTILY